MIHNDINADLRLFSLPFTRGVGYMCLKEELPLYDDSEVEYRLILLTVYKILSCFWYWYLLSTIVDCEIELYIQVDILSTKDRKGVTDTRFIVYKNITYWGIYGTKEDPDVCHCGHYCSILLPWFSSSALKV